ncbi:fibrous sheath-interacting protein 1-like [Neodiprion fabricii]|uniref:fibrous sheath-interacting protein 1-like n=1 Tax=Neodiprion fabricii TaxID=2872261 RepID=UPI001ED9074C|nr:fibrous sheath-interacting protein 1-like [Neodiprion fabricii]
MSNDSLQESPSSIRHRFCPSSAVTQIQIERLKREDEEEHWISGEELYTEGSSDDEDDQRTAVSDTEVRRCGGNARGNSRSRWGQSSPSRSLRAAIPSKVRIGEETEIVAFESTTSSEDKDSSLPETDRVMNEDAIRDEEEDEEEISWRPKREDSVAELRELQIEYRGILETVSELKESLDSAAKRETDGDSKTAKSESQFYCVGNWDISLFSDDDLSRWSNAVRNESAIEKEIFNIGRLDGCIDELNAKVKKAAEETFREQLLNRKKLRKLQNLRTPETGKLAENSKDFFKLINSTDMEQQEESEEIDGVTVRPIYQPEMEDNLEDLASSGDEEESRKSKRDKLKEKLKSIEKRREDFIERNKELASRAMGSLALTDEEKKRLEELVEDSDEEEDQRSTSASFSTTASFTPYTIDREADELLKNLTEKIANINSESYQKSEEDQRAYTRDEILVVKEQVVLNSLRTLAESGTQIIHPISECEIRRLIDEFYAERESGSSLNSVSRFSTEFSNSGTDVLPENSISSANVSESPTISRTMISELVKEARATMPLFQFKHPTDDVEELNIKDEENENAT